MLPIIASLLGLINTFFKLFLNLMSACYVYYYSNLLLTYQHLF